MNLGKLFSFISPAAGLATGHGLGKVMPYMGGLGLGALLMKLMGHHGGGGEAPFDPMQPDTATNMADNGGVAPPGAPMQPFGHQFGNGPLSRLLGNIF